MKSRPRARPLPRDAGRTRPPPSKRETGRHPGLFDGKQTGPFRPSQRNSNPPSAFEKGNGPASGLFNGTQARNRPSKREPGRAKAFSTGSKPFPMEFESARGLPKGKRARNPPFPKENMPDAPAPSQRERRPLPRPSRREANQALSAFPAEFGHALGLPNGKRARHWHFQRNANPQPPFSKETGRATAFSSGRKPFPTEFKPALDFPTGKRARIRPFQRNASPQPPFSKETGCATAFA